MNLARELKQLFALPILLAGAALGLAADLFGWLSDGMKVVYEWIIGD